MSTVHSAKRGAEDHAVALKSAGVPSAIRLAALSREVELLRGLQHPGVIRLIEGRSGGSAPWFAMELHAGGDLEQHLRRLWRGQPHGHGLHQVTREATPLRMAAHGSLCVEASSAESPPPAGAGELGALLPILHQLSVTVADLHRLGVCHGDLKPANVLLRGSFPILIDFGLWRPLGQALQRPLAGERFALFGSPAYMAPECLQGRVANTGVDLYSLGCLMYQVLTGRPPFLGSEETVRALHAGGRPLAPRERVVGLSENLNQLVLALLEKEPHARPSIEEVASRLARECERTRSL